MVTLRLKPPVLSASNEVMSGWPLERSPSHSSMMRSYGRKPAPPSVTAWPAWPCAGALSRGTRTV
jgi:hypothetical protein